MVMVKMLMPAVGCPKSRYDGWKKFDSFLRWAPGRPRELDSRGWDFFVETDSIRLKGFGLTSRTR